MNYTKAGFTLIELLVVIAIIGLLSSVVFASLNSARAKGRDARRISDLKQVQTALALCYEKKGSFNLTSETTIGDSCTREALDDGDFVTSWGASYGCSEFLSKLPVDPLTTPLRQYAIRTTGDYQHVALLAALESSPNAMTTAQILSYLSSLGITNWSQCTSGPQYNYVIGL